MKEVTALRSLCSLAAGESGTVDFIKSESALRRRLFDIGVVGGTKICCLQKSIFGDPAAYLIRDTVIAIRNDDAKNIILKEDAENGTDG
ncbi:MAG: ferrous iron transport protein A [Acutalibacteraceae bacterium]